MQTSKYLALVLLLQFLFAPSLIGGSTSDNDRKAYIVYMGELPDTKTTTATRQILAIQHNDILSRTIGDKKIARRSKIHSYGWSINGFVANLRPDEASRLAEDENVVSVFPNTVRELHTTRTWDFLGMPETVKRRHKAESNLVVGILDTGVWLDSPSFKDEGYGPPPLKWKGKCDKGVNFTGCNNKIIGARYFNIQGMPISNASPLDTQGHGTHTASIAAGVPVKGASLYGIAKGTARGGVSSARIAVYKVCWSIGCTDMDLLAGFDRAIADGVDVISISVGGYSRAYFQDVIAIGSFHAMRRGILTSCSAGNSGPTLATVQNVAPWILTVAATSLDRQLKASVKLGNGKQFSGLSINTFSPKKKIYPLTSGVLAANDRPSGSPSECDSGTLSASKVKNKIVYCEGEDGSQDFVIKDLGGAGLIMSGESDVPFNHVIPATITTIKDGRAINKYINSTKNAQAVVYKTRAVNMTAPYVASFSSRGPQSISLNILKPDVAAPGLSILAAYPPSVSITDDSDDTRHANFNILSGTSMACPHAAGAAAYVKSFHPKWSPAAIRSALMTTATPMKIKQDDAELGSGAGQISPSQAIHPGLIYDIDEISYIRHLCKEGYNSTTIGLLTGDKKKSYNCSSLKPAQGTDGLNYPSMHLQVKNELANISAVFYRTVTNVGYGKSLYKAKVESPKNLQVKVIPNVLKFDKAREKRSFKVTLKGKFDATSKIISASLKWSDSKHTVTSPIVVTKPFSD